MDEAAAQLGEADVKEMRRSMADTSNPNSDLAHADTLWKSADALCGQIAAAEYFILANPPLNISDWGGERLADDKRCQHRAPLRKTPISTGRSTQSTTWHPPAWPGSCSPTARCRPASPARARSASQ